MIVGVVAALLSLIFWSGAMRGPGYRRREYVEGEPYPRRRGRRTVVEEEEDPGPPPA
jgi:hypothetical protein